MTQKFNKFFYNIINNINAIGENENYIPDDEVEPIPTKPGVYNLARGSHDGNQQPSDGIYANGIHYTTDYTTASEFGKIHHFYVTLKNPIVLSVNQIYKLGPPDDVTSLLIRRGYDSLVIPHKKIFKRQYSESGDDDHLPPTTEVTEYEVIVFKK